MRYTLSLSKSIQVSSLLLGSIALLAGSFSPAYSQQSIQDIPQVNPGLLAPGSESATQDEQQKQKSKLIPPEPSDAVETKIDVPQEPASVQIETPKFMVNTIMVDGVTLLKPEEWQPLAAPYQGREVSLDELGQLVEKLNDLYRKKGYLTSLAYIPPQDIDQGSVVIKVVEGKVGHLSITGNKYYKTSAIERWVEAEPGSALNITELEKDLNRANQQQQFRLKAILSPGENTGETDLNISVSERQPWQITPTFDNQGRPFIGTYRWGVELANHNLLGYGDHLFAKWLMAAGTQVALASYGFPINKHGTELGFNYSFSHVNVDLEQTNQPEIIGNAHNYGVYLSHPLTENRTLVADIGMNLRRIDSKFNGDRTNRDDIATLVTGLTFNKPDRLGRTFARLQSSLGADWFGANRNFWKSEAQLTRLVRLPHNNLLIFRGYAQYSPDALPAAEEFQLGGAYSVRGYTEGLLIGDRGYSFGVEHRWPIPFLNKISPWLHERIQGAEFFDMGQTWLDQSNSRYVGGLSNSSDRTLLIGAGFGLRARLTRLLQGFVDVGFGLTDRGNVEPNTQPSARIHFGVRSDLLPDYFNNNNNASQATSR